MQGVADVIYFKQTIANACGSYALLHSLANAELPLSDDSPLKDLFERCREKVSFRFLWRRRGTHDMHAIDSLRVSDRVSLNSRNSLAVRTSLVLKEDSQLFPI